MQYNINKYRKLNKTVKYEVKRWKKKLLDKDVEDMEVAYAKNNTHELLKRVKKLAGERDKTQLAAKNKEGILKTAPEEVMMWLSAVQWYDRCCICCAANR